MQRDEAEDFAVLRIVCVSRGTSIVIGSQKRSIVDVTRQDRPFAVVTSNHTDGVILVPTFATKMHRVQALLWSGGKELLAIDSDLALACRFKRGIGMSSARDELMQLEGEEAAR